MGTVVPFAGRQTQEGTRGTEEFGSDVVCEIDEQVSGSQPGDGYGGQSIEREGQT